MEQDELLRYVARTMESLGIPYYVTGSFAGILFGEVRHTNDIDVVLDLPLEKVDAFCAAFPQDVFYIERTAVVDAIRNHFQFNVIHKVAVTKVDFIIPERSPLSIMQFKRCVRFRTQPDVDIAYITPEDLILKKLEFHRASGSEKHLRDVAGILKKSSAVLDKKYLGDWVERLGVDREWARALRLAKQEP
jgi:hypothetical protein